MSNAIFIFLPKFLIYFHFIFLYEYIIEILQLKNNLASSQQTIKSLRDELNALRHALANCQSELDNVCIENSDLTDKLEAAKKDISNLHKEVHKTDYDFSTTSSESSSVSYDAGFDNSNKNKKKIKK